MDLAIKLKITAALLILAVSFPITAYSNTDILLSPHSDMRLIETSGKEVITLPDALDRLDEVSPDVKAAKQQVDQFLIKSNFKPEERATPMVIGNGAIFIIPGTMIQEEIRKFTLGKKEKRAIKTVNEAYAVIAYDNYLIVLLETKNDLKKLYVSSVINENHIEALQNNLAFFEAAYNNAEILKEHGEVLPSDLLKVRNYRNEVKRKLEIRQLKSKIYNQNLSQIINTNQVVLTKDNALITNHYQIDMGKLGEYISGHPEIRKNVDLFEVIKNEKVYREVKEKPGFINYISITVRRVVFEGPVLMIKEPNISTFIDLFRDPNYRFKEKYFQKELETAQTELEACILGFVIQARDKYVKVETNYLLYQQSLDELEYNKRVFFEKQKLYEENLISFMDLVDSKATLYKAEQDYLDKLEMYNESISDLQYFIGKY